MPLDQLVQLASLGGFAFAAGCLLLILLALFNAVRKGELVPRSVHDSMVQQLRDENAALRQDLRDAAREAARLVAIRQDRADR